MNRLERAVDHDLAGAGAAPSIDVVRRRARRQQMRRAVSSGASVVVLAVLLVIAISVSGSSSNERISTAPRATTAPTTETAPLSARLVLPSLTMRTGSTMEASVVVENNTGSAIAVQGCHDIFQVRLENAVIKQEIAWLACLQTLTIPTGTSTYPVTVVGSYRVCFDEKRRDPLECPDTEVSPLPAGEYQVVLVESGDAVPIPPPLTVTVTQ